MIGLTVKIVDLNKEVARMKVEYTPTGEGSEELLPQIVVMPVPRNRNGTLKTNAEIRRAIVRQAPWGTWRQQRAKPVNRVTDYSRLDSFTGAEVEISPEIVGGIVGFEV